jgi:hypothetical protein
MTKNVFGFALGTMLLALCFLAEAQQPTAGAFAVKLQFLDVVGSTDIETAFRAAGKRRTDANLALGNPVLNCHENSSWISR